VKLAVVSPRYGTDVAGGAETAARLLATNLRARTGWDVEALTTCALDATTWRDHYPPGRETIDGVPVTRFPVTGPRAGDFDALSARLFRAGYRPTSREQRQWIACQGPVAPGLIDAIARSDADAIAFHPYLYHPTVVGVPAVAERAVLHPAAHDEAPIRLPLFREVFDAAAGLVYWSDPERRFVEHLFPVGARRQLVLGLGVEAGTGREDDARGAVGAGDRPFLLCLGRVDDGKGARVIASCFAAYKDRHPGPLALVFAGPVVHRPDPHPDIVVAGAVSETVKWGLLRGALAFVTPSAYESFSIVLMEAWSVGTPALVNGRSPVTREHAARSGGAFAFASYPEFEVALERMEASEALRTAMGAAGRAYVDRHFRWPDVTARYAQFLESVVNRRG
jgi:glycosyltransferase involved in cell wall biosynthesis